MSSKRIGVLVMAYGSPDAKEDVEAYYTHIRRGRKPTQEQLDDLISRYEVIGGSPLNAITQEVAESVEKLLNRDGKATFAAYVGMKHWHPFIDAAVRQMAEDGIEQAVALALAPQYSEMSVEEYMKAAREEAARAGVELVEVPSWHLEPLYVEVVADKLKAAVQRLSETTAGKFKVIFTAHSLPERILEWDDPYPKQLEETCQAVAKAAGVDDWVFAYQSASATREPWLGPDLLDAMADVKEDGYKGVVVCPVGFVTDHLEILYDIDVEAKERADELGMSLERTASLHHDPRFAQALANIVRRRLEGVARERSADKD